MHHHTHLFWLALAIVATLAALLLVRLGFKRRSLSRAQRAQADAGVPLPELKAHDAPGPADRDPHR